GTPTIHFGTGTATLLPLLREAGGDVIGLDWRVDLAAGWAAVGHDVAVQGNLDPAVLLAAPPEIRKRAKDGLGAAGGRTGHRAHAGAGRRARDRAREGGRGAPGLRRHAQLASVPARHAGGDGGARTPACPRRDPVGAPLRGVVGPLSRRRRDRARADARRAR